MRLFSPRPMGPDSHRSGELFRRVAFPTDLDAVLVTHQHPDHLDPQNLPALLAANPSAMVLVEPSILDLTNSGNLRRW